MGRRTNPRLLKMIELYFIWTISIVLCIDTQNILLYIYLCEVALQD